jgi:hypothetical protein
MTQSSNTPFTEIYMQWLDSFRALIPGGWRVGPSEAVTRKVEQAAANEEWEHEGGSVKPAEKQPGLAAVPKIPL